MNKLPESNSPRNWTEDYNKENGNYICTCSICKEYFYGYKRRTVCKVCHAIGTKELQLIQSVTDWERLKWRFNKEIVMNEGGEVWSIDAIFNWFKEHLDKPYSSEDDAKKRYIKAATYWENEVMCMFDDNEDLPDKFPDPSQVFIYGHIAAHGIRPNQENKE